LQTIAVSMEFLPLTVQSQIIPKGFVHMQQTVMFPVT